MSRVFISILFTLVSCTYASAQEVDMVLDDFSIAPQMWRIEHKDQVLAGFFRAIDDSATWARVESKSGNGEVQFVEFIDSYYRKSASYYKFDADAYIASGYSNTALLYKYVPRIEDEALHWDAYDKTSGEFMANVRQLMRQDKRYVSIFMSHPDRVVALMASEEMVSVKFIESSYLSAIEYANEFAFYNMQVSMDLSGSGSASIRYVLAHVDSVEEARHIIDYFVQNYTLTNGPALQDYSMITENTAKYIIQQYARNNAASVFARLLVENMQSRMVKD
jgi:hypothetical protein